MIDVRFYNLLNRKIMVNVKFQDGGYLIENKVLFGFAVPNSDYINLATEPGEHTNYSKLPYQGIDYPGEYNIGGTDFKVYLGKNNKLNYIMNLNNKLVGIIQSVEILEQDEVVTADYWLFEEDNISSKIDQLELEWKKYKFDQEKGVEQVNGHTAESSQTE